jgi:protein-tyrosine kinase
MNKHSPIKSTGSLLERASELYDFGAALRGGSANVPAEPVEEAPVAVTPATAVQPVARQPMPAAAVSSPRIISSCPTDR